MLETELDWTELWPFFDVIAEPEPILFDGVALTLSGVPPVDWLERRQVFGLQLQDTVHVYMLLRMLDAQASAFVRYLGSDTALGAMDVDRVRVVAAFCAAWAELGQCLVGFVPQEVLERTVKTHNACLWDASLADFEWQAFRPMVRYWSLREHSERRYSEQKRLRFAQMTEIMRQARLYTEASELNLMAWSGIVVAMVQQQFLETGPCWPHLSWRERELLGIFTGRSIVTRAEGIDPELRQLMGWEVRL